ncbi:ADP-ribosylglycohydrolase family protein [Neobacillus bataviensis]|uniref:ADP-ribosylglycohydrolase family protein n=1 Tax=Neobacillus bataviensis TaxID=220685 RepID=UPI001CBCCCE9|nr:ADP-ribosylglycohydrolase family protein [Neobacillus bataviensis]
MYSLLPVIIDYELQQKLEEGCDIDNFRKKFDEWLLSKGCSKREVFFAIDEKELTYHSEDDRVLLPIYEQLIQLTNQQEIDNHPEELSNLFTSKSEDTQVNFSNEELYDKIYGGWLGRSAGCTLGKPIELWSSEKVESYLKLTDAYPLNNYIPERKPMPDGYKFKEGTESALKNKVNGTPRDDDMDYPILNLQVLEKYGYVFTTEDVAQEWLQTMPYKQVYTAERVAYKNFIEGKIPPETARYRNPYREWIGAQIRADLWGWVNPGNPKAAAEMAYRDAILSHTSNGVYGELWMAAMISSAFVEDNVEMVVKQGLSMIPPLSRLAKMIKQVIAWSQQYEKWGDCFQRIKENYGNYNAVHTINNAAIVTMALLYSKGDFHDGITIAVMAGWDTDCNGASVGSILGVMNGASRLPEKWISPLKDKITTLVAMDRNLKLSELANRTMAQAVQLSKIKES